MMILYDQLCYFEDYDQTISDDEDFTIERLTDVRELQDKGSTE